MGFGGSDNLSVLKPAPVIGQCHCMLAMVGQDGGKAARAFDMMDFVPKRGSAPSKALV